MNNLLRPAERLLNRFTYPLKLALVGVVFLVPMVLFAYQLLSRINTELAAQERERAGVRYIHPLKNLMRALQHHRGISQLAQFDDVEAARLLAELNLAIEEHFRAIDALDAASGPMLDRHGYRLDTKAQWAALGTEAASASAEESFAHHTNLIGNIQGHLLRIADAAGLSVDPSLGTSYLIRIATVRLTQLAEGLGQLRGTLARSLSQKEIPIGDRYGIIKAIGANAELKDKLVADIEVAYALIPGLRERIAGPLPETLRATDDFIEAAEQGFYRGGGTIEHGRDIFATGTRAVDATYRLCEAILPILETAIEERTVSLMRQKSALIMSGSAALLLAAYLFIAFTRTLIRQMDTMRRRAADVVAGNLDAVIVQDSRDEMARIAGLFNNVVAALRAQIARTVEDEAKLRESEKHIRVLFNSGNDPIFVYECDSLSGAPVGHFVEVNDIACYRLGYSREELLSMRPDDVIATEAVTQPPPYIKLAYRREAVYESAHRTSTGKVIPVEINAHLFELYDRALVFTMARDISERKLAEERRKAENALATDIINRLMFRQGLQDVRLRYWLQPAENFSGDTIASARSADGVLYSLLADATGHGLTAAITVVPILTLFYRLVEQRQPLARIAHELNRELLETMPSSRFVAASLIALDQAAGTATIWQGGTPDILHLDAAGRVRERYQSSHLPLGIVEFDDSMTAVRTVPFAPGDQLALFSDGLIEAANSSGTAFGLERIEDALVRHDKQDQISSLQAAFRNHMGNLLPHDDVSLLLVSRTET